MNSQDDLGKTALMLACESGNSELIKTILNHRPDVNIRCRAGRTALMIVAETGQLDILREVLKLHADVSLTDNKGNSCFKLAVKAWMPTVIKELLPYQRWSDKELGTFMTSVIEKSFTTDEDRSDLLKALITSTKIPQKLQDEALLSACSIRAPSLSQMPNLLLSNGADVNFKDKKTGNNVLMTAIVANSDEVVFLILRHKPDLSHKNKRGENALHVAVSHNRKCTSLICHMFNIPECPICLETISLNDYYITSCQHVFHETCIRDLFVYEHSSCPICRERIQF